MTNQSIDITSKELSALAYLEASRQANPGSDRLAYFMPMVEETISQLTGLSFTSKDLRERIQSQFCINLPIAVISALLSRCCNNGYLTKDHGRYTRTEASMPMSSLIDSRRGLERETEELLAAAKRTIANNADIQKKWSDDELKSRLFHFIDSAYGDATLAQTSGANEELEPWTTLFSAGFQNEAKLMATIEALGRGAIVRDAAFFPGLITDSQAFRNTIAFFDSAIVCWALGISSYEHEHYAKEAIGTLKQSGVVCRVLSTTVDEIRGILHAIETDWRIRIADPSPNSYSRFMRQRKFTKDKVFELRSVLDQEIEKLGLQMVDSHHRVKQYVSDEAKLAERLSDECDHDGVWSNRVHHDVTCIAEVLTIREGCEPRQLNDVKAVFAAVSRRTISNVRKWWLEDERHSESVIPPILKFENLVNYVWLSNPIAAFDGIGKEATLITCASAMLPSQETWKIYTSKLEAMVKDGEMSSEKAIAIVQSNDLDLILRKEEKTKGQIDCSDADVFARVTDEVVQAISQPALDAQAAHFEDEINALNAEHASELGRKQDEIGLKQDRIDHMQEDIDRLKRQHANEIAQRSKKKACCFSVVIVIVFLAVIAGIIWGLTDGFLNDGSFNNAAIASIAIGLVGTIGVIAGVYKEVYPRLLRKIEEDFNS